jgi:hypothetical protein
MSLGPAIAGGAVLGLAVGIVVALTTDVPLAPAAGLLLGALVGWFWRGQGARREDLLFVSRARFGEALDLVVESQEPLAGQVEAVIGLQLAVRDVDGDQFLEIEQLENGQRVSLAVH